MQLGKIIKKSYIKKYKQRYTLKLVTNKRKLFFVLLLNISIFILLLKNPSLNGRIKSINSSDKYKLVVIFGTRPEVIKLIPLIKELNSKEKFNVITINTGQHKEMTNQILKSFKLDKSIDFNLNIMEKNQSLTKLTSKVILELEKIYTLINPNAVIVQGDTTTAYAASICAFYQKIPIFHIEAGLRTHNLFSPFPEEFNRKSIDILSNLYFASTNWAASNLLKENLTKEHIFITGNTVVDSLFLTLNNTSPSKYIKELIYNSENLCVSQSKCKIILLTCHRRENYNSIPNILFAIFQLLRDNDDIVIIFPFHLNPNIKQSIKSKIPEFVYNGITNGKKFTNEKYLHLNRFLMISPLDYIDLIHLQANSYFIMTDSGGIQEEGVSLGKPILILRKTTERPEAIESGCALLVGTDSVNIYNSANKLINNANLYNNMAQPHYVFGRGNSSRIISQIIENYFYDDQSTNSTILDKLNKFNYSQTLTNYDKLISLNEKSDDLFDVVIVLTVWKRNNLEKQLLQVKRQSIIKHKKIHLIIFQNSEHIDVKDIITKWKKNNMLPENIILTHIQSPIETGYYGRFLIPLTSPVTNFAYFIICDDDVIWGDRYFENMLRVVNSGSLATRNGRILTNKFSEIAKALGVKKHICYDEDIEFDFGGHLWAGKIDWLRKAWTHIPISIENSEDFWISAVLKSFHNISTKIPKCPCPKDNDIIIPDLCAVSDESALNHIDAKIGENKVSHNIRNILMRKMTNKYNYPLLNSIKPEYVSKMHRIYVYGNKRPLFNLSDDLWKGAAYWQ